jgi:hypothetical protein
MRINGPFAQGVRDHVHASANSLSRDGIAHSHEAVRAEIVNETRHTYSGASLPN